MVELILPLVFKFLPHILLLLGVLAVYFGIKRKGAVQERKKWEEAQTKFQNKVNRNLAKAESKDSNLDERVKEKVNEIKKAAKVKLNGGPGRFRF